MTLLPRQTASRQESSPSETEHRLSTRLPREWQSGWSDCRTVTLAMLEMRIARLPQGDRRDELERFRSDLAGHQVPSEVR